MNEADNPASASSAGETLQTKTAQLRETRGERVEPDRTTRWLTALGRHRHPDRETGALAA